MTRILRLDASSRHDGSQSRLLADAFVARWMDRHPGSTLVRRDLAATPIPHIGPATIQGFYTPAADRGADLTAALLLSDQLIAEVRSADLLVIATPMYNFGVPSALKAWIDHVVRIGETFSYDGTGFAGLLGGRKAVIVAAYGAGGYLDGGPFAGADFLVPYLRFLLGFLGFADIETVGLEATTADPETVERGRAAALARIDAVAV